MNKFGLSLEDLEVLLLGRLEVELEISEARLEENARPVDEGISLPLVFVGFLVPYKLSGIPTDGSEGYASPVHH